jgi:translation initiation factor IF-2
MNISTLAKILGVSVNDLKSTGQKNRIYGFGGRNTRIPYQSALDITKILRPDKAVKLKNDDKIYLPNFIKVSDFAETIGKPTGLVVKALLLNGVMVTLNEKIDYDTAALIASELGVEIFPEDGELFKADTKQDSNLIKTVEYDNIPESEKKYVSRNPVVTIMGHVDHGKTTLLDSIRNSNVASGEAGAITQHISGYQILHKNKKITFVDTPGHEAFTAMRARGSQMADFVILVVSSVEGPKPQTVEVIERCKLSKTPVIVAINKIDLPDSDIERSKNEISKYGLIPEEWGGNTPFVEISAKTKQNLDKLLDTILLHSEVAELVGQIDCPGQAILIESHLDRTRGVVSTVLVVKDSLKTGDIIRCGENVGKIRKIQNSLGKEIKIANIGEPVLLFGIPEVVEVGEAVIVYKNQRQAQTDASIEKQKKASQKVYISKASKEGNNQINLLLVADVSGSLEALKEAIIKIPQEKVKLVIKQENVGQVNESNVEFANTTNSTILAFHTHINSQVESVVKKLGVNLIQSDIIYKILEWIEEQIFNSIKPEIKVVRLGRAKVLATFKSDKPSNQILGGEVLEGKIFDKKQLRVVRDDKEIGRLDINELQKNKVKATEINISQQFGVSVTGKVKIKVGDFLECIDEQIVNKKIDKT